jgi:hypothetical protein
MVKSGKTSRRSYGWVPGKIMLIGSDQNGTLEKRFQTAGYQVIAVKEPDEAIDHARHEVFDIAVVVSAGSVINDAETIFNLRDFNPSIEIVVLIESWRKSSDRFVRQFIEHPIERTRILTRRELQKQLLSASPPPTTGAPS